MIYGKQEFAKHMAGKSGVAVKAAGESLDAVLDTIIELCANGDTVNLTGFGKFDAPVRAERIATSPRDGTKVKVPARRVPRFHAGKAFKDAVAAGK